MQYKDELLKQIALDPNSPTGLKWLKDGSAAGTKQPSWAGYVWVLRVTIPLADKSKRITYTLPRVLWELTHGTEPRKDQMIGYLDGDQDNLKADNMTLIPYSTWEAQKAQVKAWESYRNVILPKYNPDYFKAPADWTDPTALAALQDERNRRATGESAIKKMGRPQKWK